MTARIHRPRHQRQLVATDKYGKYNCAAYVLAMFADAVTLGGVSVTGKWVRANSDEPIPDTNPATANGPGLNHKQQAKVAAKLHIGYLARDGARWADVLADLEADRRISASVWYPSLDKRASSGQFGHELLLQARRKGGSPGVPGYEILANDPLQKAALWYRERDIRGAMEEWGRRTGLPSGQVRYGRSRVVPRMST